MMLGMSGMMPSGMPGMPGSPEGSPEAMSCPPVPGIGASPADPAAPDAPGGAGAVPPEVLAATMQGDVAGLVSMLRAEHGRRSGACVPEGAPAEAPSAPAGAGAPQPAAGAAGAPQAGIDRAVVDEMIRVAAENQVTVDWLVLRAVKLYLEEHRRTGRL